ncbi:MAG: glycerophosphodiester phosphodiesterase [Rickettsiales bacterium]|nr:glycerophosphodiester phosphodiesterase [Rickettsiales bacterium]
MTKNNPKRKYKLSIGGHRGNGQTDHPDLNANDYVQKYPENTLASIEAAIKAGADFIEIDVVLSKDAIPMVIHGNDLREHVFKQELPEDKYFVGQYTSQELQGMRVGRRESRDATIPTLMQVMEMLAKRNRASKSRDRPAIMLNIELKGVRGTDAPRRKSPHLAEAVHKAIEASELQPEHILLSSFVQTYLKETKEVMPNIARGMLFTAVEDQGYGQKTFLHEADNGDVSCYDAFASDRVRQLHAQLELCAVHPEMTHLVRPDDARDLLTALSQDKCYRSPIGKKLAVNTWCLQENANEAMDATIMGVIERVSKCGLPLGIITNHIKRLRVLADTLL